MQNLKENWLVLSKNFRLQADFILEGKMAELSWKQNLLNHFENYQNIPYSQEYEWVREHFYNS